MLNNFKEFFQKNESKIVDAKKNGIPRSDLDDVYKQIAGNGMGNLLTPENKQKFEEYIIKNFGGVK